MHINLLQTRAAAGKNDPDFSSEPGSVYLSGRITGRGRCRLDAPIAQTVERLHGKEKVNGSIPFGGSVRSRSTDRASLGRGRWQTFGSPGGVAQVVRAHDS